MSLRSPGEDFDKYRSYDPSCGQKHCPPEGAAESGGAHSHECSGLHSTHTGDGAHAQSLNPHEYFDPHSQDHGVCGVYAKAAEGREFHLSRETMRFLAALVQSDYANADMKWAVEKADELLLELDKEKKA